MKITKLFKNEKKLLGLSFCFLAVGLFLLFLPPVKIGNLNMGSPLSPHVAGASSYDLTYRVSQWLDVSTGVSTMEMISIGPAQWEIQGTMGGKNIRETWNLVKVNSSIKVTKAGKNCFTEMSVEEAQVISDQKPSVQTSKSKYYVCGRGTDLYFYKDSGFRAFSCPPPAYYYGLVPLGSYGLGLMDHTMCSVGAMNYSKVNLLMTVHPSEWRITGTIE